MTGFCLVRHGAYPLLDVALGGRLDHSLDGQGRAQAEAVARMLAPRRFAALLCSPVARARETAAPIAAGLGLKVTLEPDLSEIDFAGWTGMSFAALAGQPAWQDWNQARSIAAVPGGETMLAAQARAVAALQRAAARWPEADLVAVSHADIIRAILAHILGSPLDLLGRLTIDPGSVSEIILSGGGARVLRVNLR